MFSGVHIGRSCYDRPFDYGNILAKKQWGLIYIVMMIGETMPSDQESLDQYTRDARVTFLL